MRPSLIHFQRVVIRLLDRDSKDTAINEPKGRRVSDTITISAQVNFKKIGGTEDGAERHMGVLFGSANGYLICRDTVTNRRIKKGDMIVSVNGKPCKWMIRDILSATHYIGVNYLLAMPFEEGNF